MLKDNAVALKGGLVVELARIGNSNPGDEELFPEDIIGIVDAVALLDIEGIAEGALILKGVIVEFG